MHAYEQDDIACDIDEDALDRDYVERKFSEIINQEPDPFTIDNYAETALVELVRIVESILESAPHELKCRLEGRAFEEAALKEVGLSIDFVEECLDRIDVIDKIVKKASARAERIDGPEIDAVLMRPDGGGLSPRGKGEYPYSSAERINDLQALLVLLEASLDVNISEDSSEIEIIRGASLPRTSVRKTNYVFVKIPKLDRLVAICDEFGNATFVLSIEQAKQLGNNIETVAETTKTEVSVFLGDNPQAGKKVLHTKHYMSNLRSALSEPLNDNTSIDEEPKPVNLFGPLFKEMKEKGYKTRDRCSNDWGERNAILQKVIDSLGDDLGKPIEIGNRLYYGKDQQALMYEALRRYRERVPPKAPEGVMSIRGMSQRWGNLNKKMIQRVIDEDPELSAIDATYSFNNKEGIGYEPWAWQRIYNRLEEGGRFVPELPGNLITTHQLRVMCNTNGALIERARPNFPPSAGRFKHNGHIIEAYTEFDLPLIEAALEQARRRKSK